MPVFLFGHYSLKLCGVLKMVAAMSTNSDLLEIEAVHAQHQADLLRGISMDLQEAVSVLTNRAHHFEACSHSLRVLLQTIKATTSNSHSSAAPTLEDALRTANAMCSTDAMMEILEQVKRDMEALTEIMCKPGSSEQADANVYLDWKNSSRARSINLEDSIPDKLAAISALVGIEFSFPVKNTPLKVRSTGNLAHTSQSYLDSGLDRLRLPSSTCVSCPSNDSSSSLPTSPKDRSIKGFTKKKKKNSK